MGQEDQRARWRGRARGSVAVATLALVIAGCSDDDPSSATVTTDAVPSTTPATTPPTSEGRLLFSRFDESTHTFLSTHVSAPDGSGEVELTLPGPEGGGRWSHAGQEIAVMTILDDGRVGTAVVTADGKVDRTLAIADPSLNLVCTVWSPDDSRLACEGWDDADPSRSGIYAVNAADGGGLLRLTTAPEGDVDLPGDFTPDASRLLFKRGPDEQKGRLLLTDAGVATEPEPFATRMFDDPGRISPDGRMVATSAGGSLVILDADGAIQNTIVAEGRSLFGPSWSPTGQWLAYSSDGGRFQADIYVSHPDGSDVRQVTATPDHEIVVEWGAA
jgi:Tol biopolymer transport system component